MLLRLRTGRRPVTGVRRSACDEPGGAVTTSNLPARHFPRTPHVPISFLIRSGELWVVLSPTAPRLLDLLSSFFLS